jgi:ATP-dependent RNA helicase SUPV3L1/SUV3
MLAESAVVALLGPTNTGKTHRAIERMLEHASGMIGLPLRLLAREVYDKVSARVGETRVALVTGEEQRIPPRPAYWVATVEAMPVEREVEFVAVDEVQLAAHDQRGHAFTSRVLSARGTKETWLLGAETMRPILREIVPVARHVEHPRLSRLTFAGADPLARIPPRSAIVAFSMAHVYEIAEKVRARKGGAAVVLGALSPRTRNAQVAMFQAGEVDWLVATDAIGMGLNLDVEHVAFAAIRKFGGRDVRDVDEAELAQIAGRAGRWTRDGTFGTVAPLELPAGVAASIEAHRFAEVRRVRWRNDDLDYGSLDDLRASLLVPPPRPMLVAARDAEDTLALEHLAGRDGVRALARGEERVRLLWDVCTVPDFRKLLLEVHVDFLERLFVELAKRGRLSNDVVAAHVAELDDVGGDVETLIARIASTRTWTYVANRSEWLDEPRHWREATRAIEDRLSDALHERLVARFVDAKKGRARPTPRRRPSPAAQDVSARGPASNEPVKVAPAHPFAKLAAWRDAVAPAAAARSAGRAGSSHVAAWIDAVVDAPHAALRLGGDGRIVHVESARAVGAIVAGRTIALPDVRLLDADALGGGARSRLHRRLLAFARDVVSDLLGPARDLATHDASPELRGLVHRLEQGLGTVRTVDAADVLEGLGAEDRAAIARAGVKLGDAVVWIPAGLDRPAIEARVALTTVFHGPIASPRPSATSFAAPRRADPRSFAAIGYPVFGGRCIRADVAERAAARVRATRAGSVGDGAAAAAADAARTLASWLGCATRDLPEVIAALAGEDGPSDT